MGSPRSEMGRETRIFPYGESPFPNRVCFHLGTNIYAMVSFLFNLLLFVWETIPPTLFNLKKRSIPITSAEVSRLVHFSALQCNLTINHLFWMKISTLTLNYRVNIVSSICLLYLQVDPTRLVLYLWFNLWCFS